MCVGRMADMGRGIAEVRLAASVVHEAHEQNKKNYFLHATHVRGRGKLPLNLSSKRCELKNEYRWIVIWRCTCRDWPFSPALKPIDIGLGLLVHWVHI